MKDENSLVSQWEKMGSSTGGMIGRFLGLTAETGLRALDELVLTPLAQTRDQVTKASGNKGGNPEEIRASVWSKMGREYGEKMGNAIGIAMDSAIEATKNNVMKPMEQTSNQKPDA